MNKLDIIRGKIIYAESKEDAAEIIYIFKLLGAENEYGYTPLPGMGYFISTKNQICPTVEVGVSLKEFKELLKHIEYPKKMIVGDFIDSDGNIIDGKERTVETRTDLGYYAWDYKTEQIKRYRYADEIKQKSNADKEAIKKLAISIEAIKQQTNKIECQLKELTNEI